MTPDERERLQKETDAIMAWAPIAVLIFVTVLYLSLANSVATDRVCGYASVSTVQTSQ